MNNRPNTIIYSQNQFNSAGIAFLKEKLQISSIQNFIFLKGFIYFCCVNPPFNSKIVMSPKTNFCGHFTKYAPFKNIFKSKNIPDLITDTKKVSYIYLCRQMPGSSQKGPCNDFWLFSAKVLLFSKKLLNKQLTKNLIVYRKGYIHFCLQTPFSQHKIFCSKFVIKYYSICDLSHAKVPQVGFCKIELSIWGETR